LDLGTDGFTDKLHYEIPAYSFINEPFPSIVDESIAEWRHYRELAKVFYMLEGKLELIFNENDFSDTAIMKTFSTKFNLLEK
jgi:hypothetical protein